MSSDGDLLVGVCGSMTRSIIAEKVRVFQQRDIDEFGRVSGGDGLIHTDPSYAATTTFGQPVVQGLLLLALVEDVLWQALPSWAEAADLDVRFVAPVGVGDAFRVGVIASELRGRFRVVGSTDSGDVLIGSVCAPVVDT